jgi:hypothetical protein
MAKYQRYLREVVLAGILVQPTLSRADAVRCQEPSVSLQDPQAECHFQGPFNLRLLVDGRTALSGTLGKTLSRLNLVDLYIQAGLHPAALDLRVLVSMENTGPPFRPRVRTEEGWLMKLLRIFVFPNAAKNQKHRPSW